MSNSRYKPKNEAGGAMSVVSFIYSSRGYIVWDPIRPGLIVNVKNIISIIK